MNLKFKLTSETITWLGRTLFRIEALIDFGNISKGDKGGFVEVERNVSQDGNFVVIAGCRYFTFKQAKVHWTETRGGTQLGDESLQILKHLEAMVKIRHGNL